jgi:DNA-binding XRE family transcriptional regulator
MEQDDKVAAAALPLSSISTRTSSAGGASEGGYDGATEVVGSTSAMGSSSETVEGTSDLPAADPDDTPASAPKAAANSAHPPKKVPNNVRKIRIERMMSKAELARRANLSVLTIDRVERGYGCRMDTKRKLLEALGLSLADRVRVFGEEE